MIKLRLAPVPLAISALAATFALGPAAAAQASVGPNWRVVFSHHYGGPATAAGYFAVASAGPHAAWAVGGAGPNQSAWPIAAHWTGRKWFASTLPRGLTSELTAVSVDSSKDAWAVSFLGGYVLHWTGAKWSVARRFPERGLPTELTGVTAFSPTDVWVFGGSGAFPGVGTWHLHGRTWTRVHGLGGNVSFASALSPADIWAVGGINAGQDAIVHYIGGRWHHIVAKALTGMQFIGIAALPHGQVWASALSQSSAFKPYVLHLAGGHWRALRVPWQVNIGKIAPDGAGGIWLTARDAFAHADAIHLTAAGRWTKIDVGALATSFFGIDWVKGTATLWGAGQATHGSRVDAAVWAHGPLP